MDINNIRKSIYQICEHAKLLNDEICDLLNVGGSRSQKIMRKQEILIEMYRILNKLKKIPSSKLTNDEKELILNTVNEHLLQNLKLAKDCRTDAQLTQQKMLRERS